MRCLNPTSISLDILDFDVACATRSIIVGAETPLCITEGGQALGKPAIGGRGALGRALLVSGPPAGKEDRSSRPKTSPRRTPERHCLAAPPAADGQTQRDRNPLVGNHVQPGPQAVSTLSWRGSNMRAEGGVSVDVGIAQA